MHGLKPFCTCLSLKGDRTGFKDLVRSVVKYFEKGTLSFLPDLKRTILPRDFFPQTSVFVFLQKTILLSVPIIEVCMIIEKLKTLNRAQLRRVTVFRSACRAQCIMGNAVQIRPSPHTKHYMFRISC